MFDNEYCFRCKKGFKWEQMTSTPAGNLFCPECWPKIDPKNESMRYCPVDGIEMKKRLVEDVFVIDRCPQCRGVWLDRDELEVLETNSRNDGWNQGFVIGMLF